MKVEILTLFPQFFESIFSQSMMLRAREMGALEVATKDLRRFGVGKHQQADDYRFGGGAGMLMRPEPLFEAMREVMAEAQRRPLVIFPTPSGKPFQQQDAIELSRESHLVIICGHYKGIDQRVIDRWVDREYSLGDYVVTGGELAAAVIVDATARLLPGVLGDFDSARGDSFYQGALDAPHYTRPAEYAGERVPALLDGGHHKKIQSWREALSHYITKTKRPDLLKRKG